jgi:hypothetical protein
VKATLIQNRDEADSERQIERSEKKSGCEQEPFKRIPEHGFLEVRSSDNDRIERGTARSLCLNAGSRASREPLIRRSGRRRNAARS